MMTESSQSEKKARNQNQKGPVIIRQYEDRDFSDVLLLEEKGRSGSYRSAVFVRQMSECCLGTFLVAVADNRPVGYCVALIVQGHPSHAWILRMGVREGYRNTGIGRTLLSAMTDTLQKSQVCEVFLTVAPSNAPALHLYQSLGFRKEQFLPEYFGPGEDRLSMKKILAPQTAR